MQKTVNEKFWAVWRKDSSGPPNKRHATKDDCIAEAARLASQSGDCYYVLEVVGVVAPIRAPVAYSEL